MYFYGYRQHQPHAFVNKLNYKLKKKKKVQLYTKLIMVVTNYHVQV